MQNTKVKVKGIALFLMTALLAAVFIVGVAGAAPIPAHAADETPVYITERKLPDATFGVAYSVQLKVTGDKQPDYFEMWGSPLTVLPSGLSLDGNTGIISGTPTATNVIGDGYEFTIRFGYDDNIGSGKGFTLIVNKAAGAAAAKPVLDKRTAVSIALKTAAAPGNGQVLEYAVNTEDAAPLTGWQTALTFNDLENTKYYVFARAQENDNYLAGSPSASLTVGKGLGAGAIFGIVFGVFGGLIILAGVGFLIYWFVFRKKAKNAIKA